MLIGKTECSDLFNQFYRNPFSIHTYYETNKRSKHMFYLISNLIEKFEKSEQSQCNYQDNYYGDQICK